MIDKAGLNEIVAREGRMYHLLWNATFAKVTSVLEYGLERTRSGYRGFWESRQGHVYLGRIEIVKKVFFKKADAKGDWALFAVDLASLEAEKINPNEDDFAFYAPGGREAARRFQLPFSPCKWAWDWAEYLKIHPPASLGEWAEAVDLGADPAATRYGAERGSIAYRGVVPPTALRFVESNLQLSDEARQEIDLYGRGRP